MGEGEQRIIRESGIVILPGDQQVRALQIVERLTCSGMGKLHPLHTRGARSKHFLAGMEQDELARSPLAVRASDVVRPVAIQQLHLGAQRPQLPATDSLLQQFPG